MKETVIMNFSGVYAEEDFYRDKEHIWMYFTRMQGVNCYCTQEAEKEIKRRIAGCSPLGLHFLDSGNYHYLSKFWLDKLEQPCDLLVFDQHTDMQESAFFGLLSCGSWVKEVLDTNEKIRKICIVGPPKKAFAECAPEDLCRVTALCAEDLKEGKTETLEAFLREDPQVPLYVSVDKDLLCRQEARTNWDQGETPLSQLFALLDLAFSCRKTAGADICGEDPQDGSALPKEEDLRINERTNQALWEYFSEKF